jgi:hypothetical protein
MKRSAQSIVLVVIMALAIGCGGSSYDGGVSNIATVSSSQQFANRDFLIAVAKEFYSSHPDDYDMLVIWGAEEFGPGHSFYLPVKNDVPGIGYGHVGSEFFDDSTEFGSQRLQGIVWMGPDWITNADLASGPRSVLGILAQETGHRWAASLYFKDPTTDSDSRALLEDSYHWNFYLNTGSSPIGGNKWEPMGDSLYSAAPVDDVAFSQLDLYCMGLVAAEEVDPVQLLLNPQSRNDLVSVNNSKVYSRTTQPIVVEADVQEVMIEQIMEVEGERDPDVGFNAGTIRQAWIYVHRDLSISSYTRIIDLEELRDRWGDYFSEATGGRSTMNTSLY